MSLARANTSVFGYIGRRMALVNAAVVLLLIAVVGIGMVAVARYTMIQQADQALKDQANVAALDWGPSLATGQPIRSQTSRSTVTGMGTTGRMRRRRRSCSTAAT